MFHKYLFNKLVRSYVIDREMNAHKLPTIYKILSNDDYKKELFRKFQEETLEVLDAQNKQELIEEIADCYEVIDSILKVNNIEKSEVINAQNAKRNKKGNFESKYFIDSIIYNDKNPMHQEYLDYIKNKRDGEKYKLLGEFDAHVVDFIITNEAKDKIYIQKRSSTRKMYLNVWELPGGSIEMDETFHDCIKRELKEELNLDLVKIDGLIYDSEYSHKDQKHLYTVFAIEVDGWENFRLETGKVIDFKWIHAGEIEILLDGKEESSPTFGAVSALFSKN